MGKETLTDTFCRLQKKLHLVAGRLLNDETEAEDPDNRLDSEGLREELLRHLTPLQRKVFSLSTDDDMEYEDIAEALDMSIEAVRMNMCRARRTLREQYKKMER